MYYAEASWRASCRDFLTLLAATQYFITQAEALTDRYIDIQIYGSTDMARYLQYILNLSAIQSAAFTWQALEYHSKNHWKWKVITDCFGQWNECESCS